MNDHSLLQIKERVYLLYKELALRPAMFAGRSSCVLAYIAGVEAVLDIISKENDRNDSYSNFLAQTGFGSRPFNLFFEQINSCQLGFIANNNQSTVDRSKNLEDLYQKSFIEHWNEFLRWKHMQTGKGDGKGDGGECHEDNESPDW